MNIAPMGEAIVRPCAWQRQHRLKGINFLAKPPAADLVCEARILRLGKLLSFGEATIFSNGRSDGPVAHATLTYAIPPRR